MKVIRYLQKITAETSFAEELMLQIMKELGEYGRWSYGHIFGAGKSTDQELISIKRWYQDPSAPDCTPFLEASEDLRVMWGADLPGRVLASGTPEWFSSADLFPDCPRLKIAAEQGIRSAFAFPVVVGGDVVAIFEFFSLEERSADPELIELANLGAGQIVRIIERDRSSYELQRARQEALEASVAKSNFLAQVSHEIRTPLNAVMGMTHLLLNSSLNEDQRDYADSIKTSANSLLRIVNDILDISRIEAGKFEIQTADFNIEALLKDTVGMLAHVARGKGIVLRSDLDRDLPVNLRGDAGRLRQVLVNLIGNATKFTDEGRAAIRVIAEERLAGAVKIRFEVEDTGIGIPANLQPKLFDMFMQADNSAARKYGGTGLGLSISKRLVELMGGEIGFQSQEGVGSIFWFTLALEDTTQSNRLPVEAASSAALPVSSIKGQHSVLVVEDNIMNQRVMIKMLESFGVRVESADSGTEAITKVKKRSFDLIFMDCQMPGMDGYEATREIRRLESIGELRTSRAAVPIIAVTANAIHGDRERCLNAGMNDYLSKPIDPERLAKSVNYWLKRIECDLDPAALARIRAMNVQGEGDFLLELFDLFREGTPSRILRMGEAIGKRDGDILSREAHYLKSSSANLGAARMSSICEKLDEMGRKEDFSDAQESYTQLQRAYQDACESLSRHVQLS